MSAIEVRLAGPQEREACYRLAYEIFCEEMGTMRELADHQRRLLQDELIAKAHVLAAFADGEVVGTAAVLLGSEGPFPAELERGFDIPRFLPLVERGRMALNIRFLVRQDFRGSRVPFKLIVASARLMTERAIQLSFCDCQPHLLPLYTGLGFRSCAPLFDQPGFGLMAPLMLATIDLGYMRAIRSPILSCFPADSDDPVLAGRLLERLPASPPAQSTDDGTEEVWSEVFGLLSLEGGGVKAFEGLSQEEVKVLLGEGEFLRCSRGQQLIGAGHGTRTLYVLVEGAMEVRREGRRVGTMAEGEMFGEIALLLDTKRTADVVATSDMALVVALSERTLRRLIEAQSALASKFLWNLARSLALKVATRPAG